MVTKKLLPVMGGMVLVISILSIQFIFVEDADADGIADYQDNCPQIPNTSQTDFDFDKIGDDCDKDDDNDEVNDSIDAFDKNSKDWADFDFDKIGALDDTDDDNDGVLDSNDETPKLPTEQLTQTHLQEIQDCDTIDEGTSRLLCYSNFFNKLVKQEENNSDVLSLALALSKIGAIDDCHFVSHEIGHVVFEENQNLIDNLRGIDSTICRGGYYHGVIAAYFHSIKENNKPLPEFQTICNDLTGNSDYQDCIHGLGHGLVHYYLDDIATSASSCHQMSFYQSSLCIGGVMMQYTDERLTKDGLIQNNISQICSNLNLSSLDYQQCNVSLGLSLAYHTNHDLEKGKLFCEMTSDEKGKSFCLYGLEGEIKNAQEYKVSPITKETREIFQPQWTKQGSIIDFRSPAIISNFVYDENTKFIQFSFDKPSYIIMYVPNNLLAEKYVVLVNGLVLQSMMIDTQLYKDYTMIQIQPKSAGIVLITTL